MPSLLQSLLTKSASLRDICWLSPSFTNSTWTVCWLSHFFSSSVRRLRQDSYTPSFPPATSIFHTPAFVIGSGWNTTESPQGHRRQEDALAGASGSTASFCGRFLMWWLAAIISLLHWTCTRRMWPCSFCCHLGTGRQNLQNVET